MQEIIMRKIKEVQISCHIDNGIEQLGLERDACGKVSGLFANL